MGACEQQTGGRALSYQQAKRTLETCQSVLDGDMETEACTAPFLHMRTFSRPRGPAAAWGLSGRASLGFHWGGVWVSAVFHWGGALVSLAGVCLHCTAW